MLPFAQLSCSFDAGLHPDAPCRQGAAVMLCRRLRDKNTISRFPSWALRIRAFSQSNDYFSAHRLGDQCGLSMDAQLEHCVGYPLNHRSRLNTESACDLFGGQPLCNGKQKLEFSARKASAEMADPCAAFDC
jgi:hypothetical protein